MAESKSAPQSFGKDGVQHFVGRVPWVCCTTQHAVFGGEDQEDPAGFAWTRTLRRRSDWAVLLAIGPVVRAVL